MTGRMLLAVFAFGLRFGFSRLAFRLFGEVFLQFLTGFEIRHAFGGHIYRFTRLGVPTAPGSALPRPEAAKSPQLDFFPILEAANYRVEDGFYYDLGIAFVELRCACHFLYKLCFCHWFPLCRHIGSRLWAVVPYCRHRSINDYAHPLNPIDAPEAYPALVPDGTHKYPRHWPRNQVLIEVPSIFDCSCLRTRLAGSFAASQVLERQDGAGLTPRQRPNYN